MCVNAVVRMIRSLTFSEFYILSVIAYSKERNTQGVLRAVGSTQWVSLLLRPGLKRPKDSGKLTTDSTYFCPVQHLLPSVHA